MLRQLWADENGFAPAQNQLGQIFEYGLDVEQDYAEAAKWYRKAAEQESIEAQHNLGVLYEYGCGVDQDYEQALKWFTAAAEQGHTQSQSSLGFLYSKGAGVPVDNVRAHMWFRIAAENGDDDRRELIEMIEAEMSAEELEKANALFEEQRAKYHQAA